MKRIRTFKEHLILEEFDTELNLLNEDLNEVKNLSKTEDSDMVLESATLTLLIVAASIATIKLTSLWIKKAKIKKMLKGKTGAEREKLKKELNDMTRTEVKWEKKKKEAEDEMSAARKVDAKAMKNMSPEQKEKAMQKREKAQEKLEKAKEKLKKAKVHGDADRARFKSQSARMGKVGAKAYRSVSTGTGKL